MLPSRFVGYEKLKGGKTSFLEVIIQGPKCMLSNPLRPLWLLIVRRFKFLGIFSTISISQLPPYFLQLSCFLLFVFALGAITGNIQGFLLALYSGFTCSIAHRFIWNARTLPEH